MSKVIIGSAPKKPPNLSLLLATSEANTTMPAVSKYLVMIQVIGAFRVFVTPIIGMSFKRTICARVVLSKLSTKTIFLLALGLTYLGLTK